MKIETNSQYHTALAQIETYIEKGFPRLTKSETKKLETLSKRVEEFEQQKYPMPLATDISDVLQNYMTENKLNRTTLSQQLEISNSALSDIMNGKKKINIAIAKKLHQKLKLDGNFILKVA